MTAAEHSSLTDPEDGDSDALPPGTKLLNGQYVIDRYLSSGGFGITYLARDSLDRRVVIKECYPEALCSRKAKTVRARSSVNAGEFQSLVSMFVREARSIAKLNHPNIVGVHQVFEDNQTAYMALDLIEGQDLLCIVEEGTQSLSPEVIVGLLRKLLNAISTVHAVDMLHRDISPDNILLDRWGNPVLIDFGAAREQASKKSRAISALLVVKDGYSPQEFYISGSKQGPCSDLYSLAATFFHLIAGEPPPNSQNRLAALASKRPDPYEPLVGRFDGYDEVFLQAIDQTMNVFPQDRIQSAPDWLAAIDTGKIRAADTRSAKKVAALKKVVAGLVGEVDQVLADERTGGKTEVVDVPVLPQTVEKKWEYLLPADPAASMAAQRIAPPELWFHKLKKRDDLRLRKLRARQMVRRSSVLVVVGALAFNVIEHPEANFTTFAAPEIAQIVDFGRYWTTRTADILTTAL